jgi:hypothetical protein
LTTSLEGYWTPQEIATALHKSTKWVIHRITGRGSKLPELKAIKVNRYWFVAAADAEAFIQKYKGE